MTMTGALMVVVVTLWSLSTIQTVGAARSPSVDTDPYSFRTATVSSRIPDPNPQTESVTIPTVDKSQPTSRSRQGRKIRNGSSKNDSTIGDGKKSTKRRVARPAKVRTTTKVTTFAELMSETQLQESVYSKPISNSHAIPTYQFKPVTSRLESSEETRLERPPVTTSATDVVPLTNSHHFSIMASKYITETPVASTPSSRILSTLVPLQSMFTRAVYTHSTLQPTQTISLPPLTAMLFAESVPDSPNPDYSNQIQNARTVNFESAPLASSRSRSSSRVTTIEPYLLPDEIDVTTTRTEKSSPKSSRTSSKKTTSSNDTDVHPTKKRTVRHNAQNPYSYRELHGTDSERTGSRDNTRATSRPDREDPTASSRDSSSRVPARGGLGKQHIPAHLPQSSNAYIDPFEDMYDSATYDIAASEHYFDRYTDGNDNDNNDDYDDDSVYDASGHRPMYPYTGSGTRSLYTEPLIQNKPKVKEEEKKVTNTFGRQTKTMFSSQTSKKFNDKKTNDDNQKKLMMMMAMMKQNEENKKKMNTKNEEKKKDDMTKMMAAGGAPDMVMGNLLPEDAKEEMPKIQALDVVCTKEMMNVSLQFDKDFGGVIYSKGHFGQKECTYVENDKKKDFNFTVPGPDMCGTKSVMLKDKPEFLENILIVQNEPGIQEVWDSARGIRCVFDGQGGDVSQKVTAALSVAKIDQQVVSFSADTQATATLDIQVGRGPFAPSAAGLVKIGELMTLVVTVEGPEEANLLVRQCMASDGAKNNTIMLTDMNGCVVKKKLMGSWQTTKTTGDKKKPVIAFAHFQAFKFPDQMEVMIECQVDLCSGECGVCQEDMMKTMEKMTAAGRRRRRALPHLLYSASASQDGGRARKQDGVDVTTARNTLLEAVDLAEEFEYLIHPGHERYTLYQDTAINSNKSNQGSTENNASRNDTSKSSNDHLIEAVISVHNFQMTDSGKRTPVLDATNNNVTENLQGSDSRKTVNQHGSGGEGTVEFLGTAGGVLHAANLGHIDLYHRSSDRIEFAQPFVSANAGLKAVVSESYSHQNTDDGNNRIDGKLRVANKLQVLSPEDISKHDDIRDITRIYKRDPKESAAPSCMSLTQVAASVGLVLSLVAVIVLLAACLRNRAAGKNISALPEDHTFHAFSSVTLR